MPVAVCKSSQLTQTPVSGSMMEIMLDQGSHTYSRPLLSASHCTARVAVAPTAAAPARQSKMVGLYVPFADIFQKPMLYPAQKRPPCPFSHTKETTSFNV